MKTGIKTFKEMKNMGAEEKQDHSSHFPKVVVTKPLFKLGKNTRNDTWGLVLAYVEHLDGKKYKFKVVSYRKLKKIILPSIRF